MGSSTNLKVRLINSIQELVGDYEQKTRAILERLDNFIIDVRDSNKTYAEYRLLPRAKFPYLARELDLQRELCQISKYFSPKIIHILRMFPIHKATKTDLSAYEKLKDTFVKLNVLFSVHNSYYAKIQSISSFHPEMHGSKDNFCSRNHSIIGECLGLLTGTLCSYYSVTPYQNDLGQYASKYELQHKQCDRKFISRENLLSLECFPLI